MGARSGGTFAPGAPPWTAAAAQQPLCVQPQQQHHAASAVLQLLLQTATLEPADSKSTTIRGCRAFVSGGFSRVYCSKAVAARTKRCMQQRKAWPHVCQFAHARSRAHAEYSAVRDSKFSSSQGSLQCTPVSQVNHNGMNIHAFTTCPIHSSSVTTILHV